jgi:hypothetical protein
MIIIFELKMGLKPDKEIKNFFPNVWSHFNVSGSMATLIGNANV